MKKVLAVTAAISGSTFNRTSADSGQESETPHTHTTVSCHGVGGRDHDRSVDPLTLAEV